MQGWNISVGQEFITSKTEDHTGAGPQGLLPGSHVMTLCDEFWLCPGHCLAFLRTDWDFYTSEILTWTAEQENIWINALMSILSEEDIQRSPPLPGLSQSLEWTCHSCKHLTVLLAQRSPKEAQSSHHPGGLALPGSLREDSSCCLQTTIHTP